MFFFLEVVGFFCLFVGWTANFLSYHILPISTNFAVFQIEECQDDITRKERDLAKLFEQEKALVQSFMEAVGDNKFRDFLLMVNISKKFVLGICTSIHNAIGMVVFG